MACGLRGEFHLECAWASRMEYACGGPQHLIPLARIFHAPRHYVTGIALIVVALAYPWMNGGGPNYPSGEFATGAILWISALYTSLRGHLGKSSGGVVGRQGVLANEVR
jgi:hypothetical protein